MKQSIAAIRYNQCLRRRFVYFHDISTRSPILIPKDVTGTFTVLIVIRPGSGFPVLYDKSHISYHDGVEYATTNVPQQTGTVVVFDSKLVRYDPPVEHDGGACLLLLY